MVEHHSPPYRGAKAMGVSNSLGGDSGSPSFVAQTIDGHNVQEVLQRSMQTPLVILCWSARLPETALVVQTLTGILKRFGGRIGLATLDVDAHPLLAQQLGALQTPQAKLIMQGQMLAEFTGQEPEDQLIGLFTQLAGPPEEAEPVEPEPEEEAQSEVDRFLADVERLIAEGNLADAQQALEASLKDADDTAEDTHRQRVKLSGLYLAQNDYDAAQAQCDALPDAYKDKSALSARILIARECASLPEFRLLNERLEISEQDHEARYGLAIYALSENHLDVAKDHLLYLFTRAPAFCGEDGRAKQAMVALIELIGPSLPEAKSLRRQMFSLLH